LASLKNETWSATQRMFEQAAQTTKNKSSYLWRASYWIHLGSMGLFLSQSAIASRMEMDVFCGQFTTFILVNIATGQVNHNL